MIKYIYSKIKELYLYYFNRDTRDRYIGFNYIEIYKDILS